MKKRLKKMLKATTSVLVGAVVLLAVLLYGVRIAGVQIYTVLSPSMEPEYPTGSLIYVVKTDVTKLCVGQVITFRLSAGTTATHRIVEVIHGEGGALSFRTKGDSNDIPDGSPVSALDVVGKPIVCIPWLGYLASWISTPNGSAIFIMSGALVTLLVIVSESITSDKKDREIPEEKEKK